MNENTTILRINIRQVSWAKPTLPVAATATLFLPPSGGGRLGWGWLCGLRGNQIRAAHRATLSPTLSRRTGEGAGCTLRHRFLSTVIIPAPAYARTSYVGNLLEILRNGYLKTVAEIQKWIPACAGMTAVGCLA